MLAGSMAPAPPTATQLGQSTLSPTPAPLLPNTPLSLPRVESFFQPLSRQIHLRPQLVSLPSIPVSSPHLAWEPSQLPAQSLAQAIGLQYL